MRKKKSWYMLDSMEVMKNIAKLKNLSLMNKKLENTKLSILIIHIWNKQQNKFSP